MEKQGSKENNEVKLRMVQYVLFFTFYNTDNMLCISICCGNAQNIIESSVAYIEARLNSWGSIVYKMGRIATYAVCVLNDAWAILK